MIELRLKDFQEEAVNFLLEETNKPGSDKPIVVHAPTGSGKTIILISFVERFFDHNDNTVVCWLCPGKGELEQQSKQKMGRYAPSLDTGDLQDVLQQGFKPKTTYFINWETITKKGNRAISESEKKNLYDQIRAAHEQNIRFVTIIDEEHNNNTSKAADVLYALAPEHTIRVSATPFSTDGVIMYKIDERRVIDEGLITKAMYVNPDLGEASVDTIYNEADFLIDKANELRKKIAQAYEDAGEEIRPLVLVQFPNMNDELISRVEEKLASLGFNYDNKFVACWFSAENKEDRKSIRLGKKNIGAEGEPDSITNPKASPVFLLFKQALATGWDCPRAKILVKLRDNMSETFEIQTLGRLRRMPKAKHYDQDILNNAYLFTFDQKYTQEVLKVGVQKTQRLFLRPEFREKAHMISLKKQVRDQSYAGVDEQQVRKNFFEHVKQTLNLSSDLSKNKEHFITQSWILGPQIRRDYLTGRAVTMDELLTGDEMRDVTGFVMANPREYRWDVRRIVSDLKKYTGLNDQCMSHLLKRLFKKPLQGQTREFTLLLQSDQEYVAFLLNNEKRLKELCRQFSAQPVQEALFESTFKDDNFQLPADELFPVEEVKEEKLMDRNVYKGYSNRMLGRSRSTSEVLFEKFCQDHPKVQDVYKNGDKGSEYFSIGYHKQGGSRQLFYPDYIVRLADGSLWIVEAKGGESIYGQDQNIDDHVEQKFNALKQYAEDNACHFAFVRNIRDELYFNNTEYKDKLSEDVWHAIDQIFKES